jgi:hypothetical protein
MLRRINKDLGKPAIAKAAGRKRERMPSMAKFNRFTSTSIWKAFALQFHPLNMASHHHSQAQAMARYLALIWVSTGATQARDWRRFRRSRDARQFLSMNVPSFAKPWIETASPAASRNSSDCAAGSKATILAHKVSVGVPAFITNIPCKQMT